VMQK
jgi:lysyl-tRNA synthetase class I